MPASCLLVRMNAYEFILELKIMSVLFKEFAQQSNFALCFRSNSVVFFNGLKSLF